MKRYSRIENVLAEPMTSKEAIDRGFKVSPRQNHVEPGYLVDYGQYDDWMDKPSFENRYDPTDTAKETVEWEKEMVDGRLQELDEHLRGGISKKHCDETLSCLMNMENALRAYQFWLNRLSKQMTDTIKEA